MRAKCLRWTISELRAGADLRVAVCSTSYHYPLPSGWFEMPARHGGHRQTGLDQACVVKATWLDLVPQTGVIKVYGRAPARIFKHVLHWLEDKDRDEKRRRAEGSSE